MRGNVIISNMKADKSNIIVIINNINYETNKNKLGSLIGDNFEIGCNIVLNPGTIIEKNTAIYHSSIVKKEIKENVILKNDGTIVEKEL